jgi:lysozyme
MDISQRGIDLIVSFEGKHKKLKDGRYQAYLDTLADPPVWTLYCGLTRGIREGMICTEAEGKKMFEKELAIYEDAIERLVKVPLNENQFSALVSFTYNCGIGALEKSTLLKLLNQGKYEAVPAQLMRWANAGGKRYDGLVRRRKAEGALFVEPMPAAEASPEGIEEPNMPQKVEEAPAGNVGALVRDSWTMKSLAAAVMAYIGEKALSGYEFAFGVAKDAGTEILALKTTVSPLEPLLKVGLPAIVMVGICIAISRRVSARKEGREG